MRGYRKLPRWISHPAASERERHALRPPDPPERPAIREELLHVSGSACAGISLSCWRGRSGRRYVVALYRKGAFGRVDPTEAVVLAIARPDGTRARILAAGHGGSLGQALQTWIPLGTDELHVHRLARTAASRDAIVRDLIDAG